MDLATFDVLGHQNVRTGIGKSNAYLLQELDHRVPPQTEMLEELRVLLAEFRALKTPGGCSG